MENLQQPNQSFRLKFYGEGGTLFGIVLINTLLTFVTLGIYYPWARAKLLKYFYSETEFNGNRFEFHGTGKEMFKGFIKVILILIAIYGIAMCGAFTKSPGLILLIYPIIFAIIPFAIHGAMRYRLSRTSWRGIHFGYHGDLKEFLGLFFKNLLLTIVTLGIYGPWMQINLHKYVEGHSRIGNATVQFNASGGDFFVLHLKGYLLTVVTLGIYLPWYITSIHRFYIEHTSIEQNGTVSVFKTHITGGGFFLLSIVNALIVIFTLGIGYSWVRIRVMRFYIDNLELQGGFNPDLLIQTEGEYTNATGDDMLSMFEIDLA